MSSHQPHPENFIAKFGYRDRRTAHRQYGVPILDRSIPQKDRTILRLEFKEWRINKSKQFWLERTAELSKGDNTRKARCAVLETGGEIIDQGKEIAKQSVREVSPSSRSSSPLEYDESSPSPRISISTSISPVSVPTKRPSEVEPHTSFQFHCSIGDKNISDSFQTYYEIASSLFFSSESFPDFLSKHGIMFLSSNPTALQNKFFTNIDGLLDYVKSSMPALSLEEADSTLDTFRRLKDSYKRTLRITKDEVKSREALLDALANEPRSSAQRLFHHSCEYLSTQKLKLYSEADGISSFILPQFATIFTHANRSRIAYTATSPTSSSLFINQCLGVSHPPKHPDLIIKSTNGLELGFGEVSGVGVNDRNKDTGDLCRAAIWTKKALDNALIKFEGLEDLQLPFFQVLGKKATVFWMRRFGSVCVAWEVGELVIVDGLNVLLDEFEVCLDIWGLLEMNYGSSLSMIENAAGHPRTTPHPSIFHSFTATPSSRKMSKSKATNE
ncbi:hypothetical protein BGZ46_005584 [Entomortierella lignicola]|nr:hypothetical protein BGZ46_005584 [Entomortierella lignicola]